MDEVVFDIPIEDKITGVKGHASNTPYEIHTFEELTLLSWEEFKEKKL